MNQSAEDAFRSALRAEPTQDPTRLAKSLGLSGRARRKILAELEAEGVVRRRSRAWLVAGSACVGVASIGAYTLFGGAEPPRPPGASVTERRPLAPEAVAAERALYAAIDSRDPSRVQEAVAQLQSPDEPLRLAALRYLVTVDARDQTGAMLQLMDDPSGRVRQSAIQLLAGLPGEEVDSQLARAAVDEGRALSERTLALGSLEGRTAADPQALARALVPGLLTSSLPQRESIVQLLARLSGQSVDVPAEEKVALHAAWKGALGVVE